MEKIISIIIIAVISGMALFIVVYYYQEWANNKDKQEWTYENQYEAIQGYIQNWPVTPESYNAIFAELKRIGNMKYKNREKTSTLTTQFLRKYTESDEEFSPELLDFEETEKELMVANEAVEI